MDINTFLESLFVWSAITTLIVEGIGKLFTIKSKNVAAFIVAIIVGLLGNITLCYLSGGAFTQEMLVTAVLTGLASGIVSQVGYDKVKQTIEQIGAIK